MMAKKECYVAGCTNTSEKTKNLNVIDARSCTFTVVTYHPFPRQPQLRQRWIYATGRLNWEPTDGSFICSEHFRESDYEILNQILPEEDEDPTKLKQVLKRFAVPSLQLGTRERVTETETSPHLNRNNGIILPSTSELYDTSVCENKLLLSENNMDVCVSNEPNPSEEFFSASNNLPFIITSTGTVQEEIDHNYRQNGIIESSIDFSAMNDEQSNYDLSPNHNWPKRQKHQDSLIAPEDIKVERSSSPESLNLDITLSITERYSRLLDDFMQLKMDYDTLKMKYDKQCEAIRKCEHILSGCK